MDTWVELSRRRQDMAASCYALSPDSKTLAWRQVDPSLGSRNRPGTAAIPRRHRGRPPSPSAQTTKRSPRPARMAGCWCRISRGCLPPGWRRRLCTSWAATALAADAVHAIAGDEGDAGEKRRLPARTPQAGAAANARSPNSSPNSTTTTSDPREGDGRPDQARPSMRICKERMPTIPCRRRNSGWRCCWRCASRTPLPDDTARVRAVQVLETIGTDDARRVLASLTKGRRTRG